MERFIDAGLIISAKNHSDNGVVLTLLTETQGKHLGYVRGGNSSKKRGDLELGNLVKAEWQSRLSENMGSYQIEVEQNFSSGLLDEYPKLLALQSACALLNLTLAEREKHEALFYGTHALLNALNTEVWAESYIIWELALLKELGFGLDLTKCAGGGDSSNLIYVSPKSATAVSAKKGNAYKNKLLPLPQFLLGKEDSDINQAIMDGLNLTAYFLEHRVLADTSLKALPECRTQLKQVFV